MNLDMMRELRRALTEYHAKCKAAGIAPYGGALRGNGPMMDALREAAQADAQPLASKDGDTMNTDRDALGRWAPGNPGGPGRPPRPTELVYLAALADAVTLDDWRAIVTRAKDDALQGDAKARDWLAARLIGGDAGATLAALALREHLAITPGDELEARAAILAAQADDYSFQTPDEPLEVIAQTRGKEWRRRQQEAEAAAAAAERERRRQARAARQAQADAAQAEGGTHGNTDATPTAE
jgi:hypothetical protein